MANIPPLSASSVLLDGSCHSTKAMLAVKSGCGAVSVTMHMPKDSFLECIEC
jgi:hypothetical protein